MPLTPEGRKRIIEANTNREISAETRYKLGNGKRGVAMSEKQKAKISETMRGVPKSDTHKENIRRGKLGKPISERTKRRIANTKRKQFRERKDPRKYAILNALSQRAFGEDYKSLAHQE